MFPKAKRPRKVKTVVRYASVTPPRRVLCRQLRRMGLALHAASQIRRTRRFAAQCGAGLETGDSAVQNNKEGCLAKRRVQRLPDCLKKSREQRCFRSF